MLRRVSRYTTVVVAAILCLATAGNLRGVRGASQEGAMDLRSLSGAGPVNGSAEAAVARTPPGSQVFQIDDGSYEQALGVTDPDGLHGSQAVFLNRFTPSPAQVPVTIDAVSILFPTSSQPGPTGLEPGMMFEILVYVDPSSNADPTAASLVRRQPFRLSPSNTIFQTVPLDSPVTVNTGTVYVGFTNTVTASTNEPIFPGALDTNTSQALSFAFFNRELFSHFDGTNLSAATSGPVVLSGNWLIRAFYSVGGAIQLCWDPVGGAGAPPPANARVCTAAAGSVAPLGEQGPRDTLLGYNVYRGTAPGVQPTPANFYTSTPPTVTTAGSSVAPGGSFFVVTAVYDTGESDPSNEASATPGTITSVKVKPTKVVTKGAAFTATVQVFVDGIPFVSPATVKNGSKVTQKGNLLTGQSVRAYLSSHGGTARMTIRNTSGATVTATIQ